MLKFYKFIISNGSNSISNTLPFPTTDDFFIYLKKNNLKLISYKIIYKKLHISDKEMLFFTQNLISLLESGLHIALALEIIKQQDNRFFSHIIENIKNDILNGEGIYNSFNKYNTIFSPTYLNLLHAGETTNHLIANLKRAHRNLSLITSLKNNIKKTIFYPAIVGFFIVLLLIFIFIFVLPDFTSFFHGSQIELPFITKLMLQISNNFLTIGFTISLFILLLILLLHIISKETKEKIQFKIPIIKNLTYKKFVINFSENFAIMLNSNIEIIDILEFLKNNCEYLTLKQEIYNIQKYIENGYGIYHSFKLSYLFNTQQLNLINIGEQSGTLAKTFETISAITNKELEQQLFQITTIIQPLLLLFLGIITGSIIVAIYMPIMSISDSLL